MTTTVRETLTLDSFKGFRVIAGQSGLDREVSTTTFIEAPDSWKWIRGGEFVLTLGYAFQEESQLFDLVHKLIDHGASCIGIKTERFLKRIPENVLELAEQHSFPVIDIPISVPFAEIIHPVQSLRPQRQGGGDRRDHPDAVGVHPSGSHFPGGLDGQKISDLRLIASSRGARR